MLSRFVKTGDGNVSNNREIPLCNPHSCRNAWRPSGSGRYLVQVNSLLFHPAQKVSVRSVQILRAPWVWTSTDSSSRKLRSGRDDPSFRVRYS